MALWRSARHALLLAVLCSVVVVVSGRLDEPAVRNAAPPTLEQAEEAMNLLLGGEDAVAEFLETAFERTPFQINDSSRADRPTWIRTYRGFVPNEDVDEIIRKNSSTANPGTPLLLGQDLDMLRVGREEPGFWGRNKIASFADSGHGYRSEPDLGSENVSGASDPDNPDDLTRLVDHIKVHQAFGDGFEIAIYNLQDRILYVHDFIDRLAWFWKVPARATLHFAPTKTARIREKAPLFMAEDQFIVVLDGKLRANVYKGILSAPFPEHVEDAALRAEMSSAIQDDEPDAYDLKEGDVLYIPRGYAADCRTREQIALYVTLELETYRMSYREALLHVVDRLQQRRLSSNPLRDSVEDSASNSNSNSKISYGDLVRVAIHVASQFTDDMRMFYPGEMNVGASRYLPEGDVPDQHLSRRLDMFGKAAEEALFGPLVETLAEGDEHLQALGSQHLTEWAVRISRPDNGHFFDRAERMFHRCLRFLIRESANGNSIGPYPSHLHRTGGALPLREQMLKRRSASLAEHGWPVRFVAENLGLPTEDRNTSTSQTSAAFEHCRAD